MAHYSLMSPGNRFLQEVVCNSSAAAGVEAAGLEPGDIALRLCGCAILLAFSALFSGLTLGVMGLDTNQLEIVRASGSAKDQRNAAIILTVRKQGNLLLCTLLFGNVGVNSLMSILLADLTTGLVGFLVSTVLIVILGEVIPQAACSRYALRLGAMFVPVVRVIIVLLWVVAKPVSLVLDYWLGEEIGVYYSKQELKKLVMMHAQTNRLNPQEAAIVSGAISYREKFVKAVMTPAVKLFAVCCSDRLDYQLMAQIYRAGYSRIPVWNDDRSAIIGLLYAKDLMLIEPRSRTPVITVVHFFGRQHVNVVDDEETLDAVLKMFSSTRQHFAIVRTVDSSGPGDPVYKVAGVITAEDIMEEILQEEIVDEYDVFRQAPMGNDAASNAHNNLGIGHAHTSTLPFDTDPARVVRQEAAIRRLYEATAGEDEVGETGHGINNNLTVSEIDGLTAHLVTNTAAFKPEVAGGLGGQMSFHSVQHLLRQCKVIDVVAASRRPPKGAATVLAAPVSGTAQVDPTTFGNALIPSILGRSGAPAPADVARSMDTHVSAFTDARLTDDALYLRGELSTTCTIILEGEMEVVSGADRIKSVYGPWDVLAEGALSQAEGVYRTDFEARPLSTIVRCLRITKGDYNRFRLMEIESTVQHLKGEGGKSPTPSSDNAPFGSQHRAPTVESWLQDRGTTLPPAPFSALANQVLPPPPHREKPPRHAHAQAGATQIDVADTLRLPENSVGASEPRADGLDLLTQPQMAQPNTFFQLDMDNK